MSGEKRTSRVLSTAGALRALALGLVVGGASWPARPTWLGPASLTVLGGGVLVGMAITSRLADRLGRRRTVALGLVLAAAGLSGLAFVTGPAWMLVGALSVSVLPLEPAGVAWMRESIVVQRRAEPVGRLLAVTGLSLLLGLVLGLSLSSRNVSVWVFALVASAMVATAAWVLGIRTDPPVGHRLPAAIDRARVQGWLAPAPGRQRGLAGLVLGLSLALAALLLLAPALTGPVGGGASRALLPLVLAGSALLGLRAAARVVELGRPLAVPAGVLVASLLALVLLTTAPTGDETAGQVGRLAGGSLWMVALAFALSAAPAQLVVNLADDLRGDAPVLWALGLGFGVCLAGMLGLGSLGWPMASGRLLAAFLAFLGLISWVRGVAAPPRKG